MFHICTKRMKTCLRLANGKVATMPDEKLNQIQRQFMDEAINLLTGFPALSPGIGSAVTLFASKV